MCLYEQIIYNSELRELNSECPKDIQNHIRRSKPLTVVIRAEGPPTVEIIASYDNW